MVTDTDVFSHVTESWLALPDEAWLTRAQELGLYVSLYDLIDAATTLHNDTIKAFDLCRQVPTDHWFHDSVTADPEFQRSRQRLDAICKAWLTISKEWEQ